MKKCYTFIFILLLVCFAHTLSFAQVGKGQKQLEDKNYAGAQASFAKDFNDPKAGPAAYLGWAKAALSAKTTTYDSAMMAHQYLELADSLYKAADSKIKADMQKEGMSTGGSDTQKKAALTKAWEGLVAAYQASPDNPAYFDQLDQLAVFGFFKRGASNKKIADVRSAIVGQAWATRDDYKSLSAIMARHYDATPAALTVQRGMTRPNRLWKVFISEVGMDQFDLFKKTHPTHWASTDCKADAAIKAFKSESIADQFKFFTDNPESCLTPDALTWWYSKLSDKNAAGTQLGSSFNQYATIAEILINEASHSTDNAKIVSAVKAMAPAQVAFAAVQRGVDMHFKKKDWDKARVLINETETLFNEDELNACSCASYTRKSWFKQITKIIDTPDGPSGAPKSVSQINTASNEANPVVAGPYLYLAAEGRPSGVGKTDPFRVPIGLAGVKGELEPTTTFAAAGDEYVMSTTADGSEAIISIDGEAYYTTLGAKGWSKPAPLAAAFSTIPNIGRATLSPLGDYLIFTGKGVESIHDLYISSKNYTSGGWNPASPLPKSVNTRRSEKSPFLHADGKSLYFASDGHLGLGGRDLFMSKRLDDTWLNWGEPVNLGKMINTINDDSEMSFSVLPQGNVGYYAIKDEKNGKSDIYSIELPEHARAEPVNVVALKTNMPNQQVRVTTVDGDVIKTIKAGPEGQLSFALGADYETVLLTSSADSIFSVPLKVEMKEAKNNPFLSEELRLQTVGQLFQQGMILSDGVFQNNGTDLTMEGQTTLDRYYKLVSKRNAPLAILAHGDNGKQAEGRAEAVKNALIGFGYDAKLITIENKGTTEPLGANDSESGKKRNRRVEVKVLKKQ